MMRQLCSLYHRLYIIMNVPFIRVYDTCAIGIGLILSLHTGKFLSRD